MKSALTVLALVTLGSIALGLVLGPVLDRLIYGSRKRVR